jgi:hypothetical protein
MVYLKFYNKNELLKMASWDLGSCPNKLFYKYTNVPALQSNTLETLKFQHKMELGNMAERQAKEYLKHNGYTILTDGSSPEDKTELEIILGELIIVAKRDGSLARNSTGEVLTLEVKRPNAFSCNNDIKFQYYIQDQTYLHCFDPEKVLMVKYNTDFAEIPIFIVKKDTEKWNAFLDNTIIPLYNCIRSDTFPNCNVPDNDYECNYCNYRHICPKVAHDEDIKLIEEITFDNYYNELIESIKQTELQLEVSKLELDNKAKKLRAELKDYMKKNKIRKGTGEKYYSYISTTKKEKVSYDLMDAKTLEKITVQKLEDTYQAELLTETEKDKYIKTDIIYKLTIKEIS